MLMHLLRLDSRTPLPASEHRLFSFITMNCKAQPLVSYRVIVDLISATATKAGLTVRCELDTNAYPKGIVVSDRGCPLSTSRAMHSTANGTTPCSQSGDQAKHLSPDEP